jgi:hypothetical protein
MGNHGQGGRNATFWTSLTQMHEEKSNKFQHNSEVQYDWERGVTVRRAKWSRPRKVKSTGSVLGEFFYSCVVRWHQNFIFMLRPRMFPPHFPLERRERDYLLSMRANHCTLKREHGFKETAHAHCVMAGTKYNARLSFQSELPVKVLGRLLVT